QAGAGGTKRCSLGHERRVMHWSRRYSIAWPDGNLTASRRPEQCEPKIDVERGARRTAAPPLEGGRLRPARRSARKSPERTKKGARPPSRPFSQRHFLQRLSSNSASMTSPGLPPPA